MGKLYENGKLHRTDDQMICGTVLDFLEDMDYIYRYYPCLHDLIETMTGDGSTEFDTIGELFATIPEIVSCSEECSFLNVIDNDKQGDESKWFILGWDHEDNETLWNKILQTYFPDFRAEND